MPIYYMVVIERRVLNKDTIYHMARSLLYIIYGVGDTPYVFL
jgi:hypothetical protein